MITESVVRVILHCSRCNTPFKDAEYEGSKAGHPKHPLYLPASATPVDYPLADAPGLGKTNAEVSR